MISEEDRQRLTGSVVGLEKYVRGERYEGHDPYDALLSPFLRSLTSRYARVAVTQLMVYSPIDLRRALKVAKGMNPKALGLFLSAYCDLRRAGVISQEEFETASSHLIERLMSSRSPGYSGSCWGFNFPWQDVTRYSDPGLPTVVVSSFVGNSLLDAYLLNRDEKCLKVAKGVCDFILRDLNVHEDDDGICYSYTPIDHHTVHNASAMGAAYLARVYSLTGRKELLDGSERAIDHLLAHQEEDGSWAYSYDPRTGRKRMQLDFHQGFVLSSLMDFMEHSGLDRKQDMDALMKGGRFFRDSQFHPSGRSYWRLPWARPADIHHQAQGVLTFTQLGRYDPSYRQFALKVATWTVENMQDPSGPFYHQCYGPVSNRIPYMRWGQAWMMLALGRLLRDLKGPSDPAHIP